MLALAKTITRSLPERCFKVIRFLSYLSPCFFTEYQKSGEPYSAELMNLVTGQHKKILHLEQKLNRANAFAERTRKRLAVLDSLLKVDEIPEC